MKVTTGELWLTIGGILGVGALIAMVLAFVPGAWDTVSDYMMSFFNSNKA